MLRARLECVFSMTLLLDSLDGSTAVLANYVNTIWDSLPMVGRCRLTVSTPVLKAPMVSALETRI